MGDVMESSQGGRFWPGFRREILACLRDCLQLGTSGALVGLAGSGKSNLLTYLALYPERVIPPGRDFATVLVPVDLNHLIDRQPATLYRLILRACYQVRARFPDSVAMKVQQIYESNISTTDPFMAQTAVHDLLLAVAEKEGQLVLLLDQFDRFFRTASPELTTALRGLRDSFKETMIYIVGMRQAAMFMPDPGRLGELHQLLDSYVCWVGGMSQTDAQMFLVQEAGRAGRKMLPSHIEHLVALTGGYPSLLKAAVAWWLTDGVKQLEVDDWREKLGQKQTVRRRLEELWQGLNQEEQWLLGRLHLPEKRVWDARWQTVLERLARRGLCQHEASGWEIRGDLLTDFVRTAVQRGLGRIWQDEVTGELYQGSQRLDELRPLEEALLLFFIQNPYKPHTKSEIIRQVWPEGTQIEGVTDDSLYQVVRRVRLTIEPETAESPVYLLTKRGVDEGGYQFFPEGYPVERTI